VKPKTLGLLAALVAVPTLAAAVPGRLAGAVSRRPAGAATPTTAHSRSSQRPAAKGGTASLVNVTVTTASDGSSPSRDALREPGRRRVRGAGCTNPGAGTTAYSLTGTRASSTTSHFNPAGAPVSGAASVLQAAFGAWAGAGAPSISVASDGTATAPTADHTYETMFADLGPRTLAVTYTWRWSTGEYENDTAFNRNVSWFVAPGEGDGCYEGVTAYDLQDVATHEFGHVYGLGHVTSPFNTMSPTATAGETYKRSLAPGDALGIQAIY